MVRDLLAYQCRIFFHNKKVLFLVLVFPILFALFLNFTISIQQEGNKVDKIQVAVVEKRVIKKEYNAIDKRSLYKQVLQNEIFDCTYLEAGNAIDLLRKGMVSAVIIFKNDDVQLLFRENGVEQTIVKEVLDEVKQKTEILQEEYVEKGKAVPQKLIESIGKGSASHITIKALSQQEPNLKMVFFYTILGMAAMCGAVVGAREVAVVQADQSVLAQRINLTTVSKNRLFICNIIMDCILQFNCLLIIMGFMRLILKIEFGEHIFLQILTCAIAAVCGVAVGTLLGMVLKGRENWKVFTIISFVMLYSFFAGIIEDTIRYKIMSHAMILDKINLVATIADSFYALFYYPDYSQYLIDLAILTVVAIICFVGTGLLIRRSDYDSF